MPAIFLHSSVFSRSVSTIWRSKSPVGIMSVPSFYCIVNLVFFSFPFQTLHVAPRSVPQFKSYEDEPESAPTPSSTSSGASSREHTFTRPIQHVNAPVSASAVKSRMTSGSGARASMRAGSAHTNFPKSEPGKYDLYILMF